MAQSTGQQMQQLPSVVKKYWTTGGGFSVIILVAEPLARSAFAKPRRLLEQC
jgi:hypothetical protein